MRKNKKSTRKYLGKCLLIWMLVLSFTVMTVSADADSITYEGTSQSLLEAAKIGIAVETAKTDKSDWVVSAVAEENAEATLSDVTITGVVTGYETTNGCSTNTYGGSATLTLTNNYATEGVLSFGYSVSSEDGSSATLDGTAFSGEGRYTVTLTSGGSSNIVITSDAAVDATKSVTITDLSLIQKYDVAVTLSPSQTGGSYTVDGSAVSESTVLNTTNIASHTLVATAPSGKYFWGWQYTPASSGTAKYICVNASDTLTFAEPGTLTPVFSTEKPMFAAGTTPFTNLDDALVYATADADKDSRQITQLADTTLAKSYTIPENITLLVPYDTTNTYHTGEPPTVASKGYTTPTSYRTLTLANGCTLTINGGLQVGGKIHAAAAASSDKWNAATSGPCGFIKMESGSQIIVNGTLYCYGYIWGDGTITANSTARLHEVFELAEKRGGTMISRMVAAVATGKKVFPISQYYIQNIEVATTIYSGATLTAHTALSADDGIISTQATILGRNAGLFQLSDGYLIKKYNSVEERNHFDIYGTATVSSISLTIFGVTLDSQNYVLPMNGYIDITVKSGASATIAKDVQLIPGAKLIVDSGANLNISADTNLYVYDADEWGNFAYFAGDKRSIKAAFSPSAGTPNEVYDTVDALLDINGTVTVSGHFYTTESGANVISSNGSGRVELSTSAPSAGTINQLVQTDAGSVLIGEGWKDINVTAAQLLNEDKVTYVPTAGSAANTTFAYYHQPCIHDTSTAKSAHGVWSKDAHTETATVTVPTCNEQGYTTYTCICGHSYVDENSYTSATGKHDWSSGSACSTCGTEAGAVWYVDSSKTYYEDLVAVLADGNFDNAANGTGYVQLLQNSKAVTISEPIKLDLNGCTIASVTLDEDGVLYGMDTTTNAYGTTDGVITSLISNGGTVAPVYQFDGTGKKYVAYRDSNNALSFHRFDMGITEYAFYCYHENGEATGEMEFKAAFNGSPIALAAMTAKGFSIDSHTEFAPAGTTFGQLTNSNNAVVGCTLTGYLSGFNLSGDDGNGNTVAYGPAFTEAFSVDATIKVMLDSTNVYSNSDFKDVTTHAYAELSFEDALQRAYSDMMDEDSTQYNTEMAAKIKAFVDANGMTVQ